MRRSTPQGEHIPVLLEDVLTVLQPQPGEIVFDGTIGYAGHASELLHEVGPQGRLIGTDFDPVNLQNARLRLEQEGSTFHLEHGNYASIQTILGKLGIDGVDMLLVDLGMSSMQVDDPARGFSYVREGPLDMRMDPTRGKTAADLLMTLSEQELTEALETIGDEPNAAVIAKAIVTHRQTEIFSTTVELSRLIGHAVGQPVDREQGRKLRKGKKQWEIHPAARTFQVLRILVNRELANLEHLLRILPEVLKPGGRAAIISFHSGEDRRVKRAFKEGFAAGWYTAIADEPVRPRFDEQRRNPRSRSAKLRWAIKA
ncbi:MAG: 16S rRNA (cytosine(1402)-N(4))-methyltransferase RsmH [Planctomycetia bacterium]|nr:16S rRNA (cytosine(1402)-N(4))-methyltransferase RsmH [Planctomycetia bacterium]